MILSGYDASKQPYSMKNKTPIEASEIKLGNFFRRINDYRLYTRVQVNGQDTISHNNTEKIVAFSEGSVWFVDTAEYCFLA